MVIELSILWSLLDGAAGRIIILLFSPHSFLLCSSIVSGVSVLLCNRSRFVPVAITLEPGSAH